MTEEASKLRAEIRARQAEDGKKAMAEYEANVVATRAKTERLRALRLARDAAEAAAPKPAPGGKPKVGRKRKLAAGSPPDGLGAEADVVRNS